MRKDSSLPSEDHFQNNLPLCCPQSHQTSAIKQQEKTHLIQVEQCGKAVGLMYPYNLNRLIETMKKKAKVQLTIAHSLN